MFSRRGRNRTDDADFGDQQYTIYLRAYVRLSIPLKTPKIKIRRPADLYLLRLLMRGMPIAIRAEFAHLQAALMHALVFARKVIGMLALGAFQFYHVVLRHRMINWPYDKRYANNCQYLDGKAMPRYTFHVLRRCSSVGRATPW